MKKLHILTDKQLEVLVQIRLEEHSDKMNQKYENDILKSQVELAMLQGQINPHFLYNALECIRGQALMAHVPEIAEMTYALSQFFRYSISTKSDVVTLREELENADHYLKIQQYRFGNRFVLKNEYDKNQEELLNVILPKLTLQPIIENAISHGFSNKTEHAEITIELIETKKNLNIIVSDNGEGMSKEQLKRLNDKIANGVKIQSSSDNGSHNGIAIPNIDKRIKLLFGDDYGLHISSAKGYGTDVEIRIPL